jgi:hypothetical protein
MPGAFVTMTIVKRSALQQGRLLIQHVIPAILKPAHTLWNEVIGFLFLCFTALFGFYAIRYFVAGDWGRLFFAAFCTCMMAYFGISSFRRARKISRS